MASKSAFIRPYLNLGCGNDRPEGLDSLPQLISFVAEHNPDHIFGWQSQSGDIPPRGITFAGLQNAVEHASAWLVHTGCTTGRISRERKIPPLAIFLHSDVAIFIYIAALLRIGTPVLVLSARLSAVAVAHLIDMTRPKVVLKTRQTERTVIEATKLLRHDTEFLDALSWDALFDFDSSHPAPPMYTDFKYDDTDAIILHSSGTTDLPKPIYHAQVYMLIYAACHRLPEQQTPFQFCVSTLPLYHGFGLLAPCLSLSIGMPFILLPSSVIPTATSTLEALKSTRAQTLLSVPSILEDITQIPGGVAALKSLEIIAIGGAAMKESIGDELVAQGVKLLNHWGATELGAIAPIERIPSGYHWHYLMPRTDIGLEFLPGDTGDGTYRLKGTPLGWSSPFIVQDLLLRNPENPAQFKILGRTDDVVVLCNGEKVQPSALEHVIAEHPSVKAALAFGEGQMSLGLLIEVKNDFMMDETLRQSLDPYLQRGNLLMDKHGKLAPEMLVFTTRPLVRTDKGSLARKATWEAFKKEIDTCYDNQSTSRPFPSPDSDGGSALKQAIRLLVSDITGLDGFQAFSDDADNVDFFEVGMDSLQATRLRRAILSSLADREVTLESDFCFRNCSVNKLHSAIGRILAGCEVQRDEAYERISAMEAMVDRYERELNILAPFRPTLKEYQPSFGKIILLTGSTGSLGCFLLAQLAEDPTVTSVTCLNRRHNVCPYDRQMQAFRTRGIYISEAGWRKVRIYESETNLEDFGLESDQIKEFKQVTHIIHNAWPVNFNRTLESFESHVKALLNLIRLGISSTVARGGIPSEPTRLLFTSSISVVGRFATRGSIKIPEAPVDAPSTVELGYAEAKWVCERLSVRANDLFHTRLRVSCIRIGQMSGAEGSGAWNIDEHIPIMVRASLALNALPELRGTLSWIPVNRASTVLLECLFSKNFSLFYHLENPTRQSWSTILQYLSTSLSPDPLPLIPFEKWLDLVRESGEKNPAWPLTKFMENDFERMSSGSVSLGTEFCRRDSATLEQSGPIERDCVEEYVAYWRS
ncbi:hypothetical protein C8J56DRAFT_1090464, partial [Mycena floridula]